MGWIVLGHHSQLWHSSKEGHWILSWKFRHETTLVDCLVSYACNTLVRAMVMVLAQSQLSISSEWFGPRWFFATISVLCTICHHVENPTIINIIFKILHVSLDKKGLFSVIALCPVKLLPDVPHSYYIGVEYEHVEKEKMQLFSTQQQCGKWKHINVAQACRITLCSLALFSATT